MINPGLISLMFLATSPGACLAVPGSQILARDLALANSVFSSLNPDLAFGFSPLPGSRRLILGRELRAFGAQHGLFSHDEAVADICVERFTKPLGAEELEAALQNALGMSEARIELIDYTKQLLPPGRLEFQRNWLAAPDSSSLNSPVIWRGRLNYDIDRSLAVWAKVQISADRNVVVAAEDLAPGHAITTQQVTLVRTELSPFQKGFLDNPDLVVGKAVNRSVRAGKPLFASMVRYLADVERGQKVQVRVVSGSAYVSFEGVALAGGRVGETILLRNPSGGRTFCGVIQAKGRVLVQAGGPA